MCKLLANKNHNSPKILSKLGFGKLPSNMLQEEDGEAQINIDHTAKVNSHGGQPANLEDDSGVQQC
jgi:hypothetical protein